MLGMKGVISFHSRCEHVCETESLMIVVEPKPLLRHLSRACRTALEGAVGRTVRLQHHEVTVHHVLLALLDDATCDFSIGLVHHGVDRAALREALLGAELALGSGHAGRPVFAPELLELLQEAWLVGSIQHEYTTIRSGMILRQVLWAPTRYTSADIARHLAPGEGTPDFAELARVIAASGEAQGAPPPRAAQISLPGQREDVLYRVCYGDTLLGIAREFALDVAQVAEQNRMRVSDELRPGSFLRLLVLREVVEESEAEARRLH
jgi:ATP-dependent Clp protease ATP-binding subunit ClpA